jgi:hypothetical protein
VTQHTIPITLTLRPFEERVKALFERQAKFQRMADVVDVEDMGQADVYRCNEFFTYKAIEELVEVRRRSPSVLNRWEKNTKKYDRKGLLMELCDSLLYHINICLVNGFTADEVLTMMAAVQAGNFESLKRKLLERIQDEPEGESSALRDLHTEDLQRGSERLSDKD